MAIEVVLKVDDEDDRDIEAVAQEIQDAIPNNVHVVSVTLLEPTDN